MKTATFTVLVTVMHNGEAPTAARVALQIQQGLEEGTREHASHTAALVDAFYGDYLTYKSESASVKALHAGMGH